MANHTLNRRHFFFGSLLAGAVPAAGFGTTPSLKSLGFKSPNEKLNIASIGAGGKARSSITICDHAKENIVALCDPDAVSAKQMFDKFDKAPKYTDFRKMFDKETKNIDAVIVATPDHMHAICSTWAMERGKHVYCQKPLTRTIWEARWLTHLAAKYKVATQMGNQGYSNEGTRQCAEMIWNGEIGNVTEVHAWTDRPIWPQGLTVEPATEPVPSTMDWDSWTGVSSAGRPYGAFPADVSGTKKPEPIAPFNWRGFFDYGCGALGDMACHILGAPNMALLLGAPSSVECVMQEGKSSFMFPKKSLIRFDFPARGSMPAVKIFWHDGSKIRPSIPGISDDELLGELPAPAREGRPAPERKDNGSVFIGDKGFITTGTYGQGTRLVPSDRMKDYKFPTPVLRRAPSSSEAGHHADWLEACRTGIPSSSNFAIAGPFTEWILLGTLALRFEGKLGWDSDKMRTNNAEANKLIKPTFRKGWAFGKA
jgi:predicted dehydrogenase